jgi:hypothetical protein
MDRYTDGKHDKRVIIIFRVTLLFSNLDRVFGRCDCQYASPSVHRANGNSSRNDSKVEIPRSSKRFSQPSVSSVGTDTCITCARKDGVVK